MSMVMEEAMEYWNRGLGSIPDKNVCSAHFPDYAIRRFIRRNGITSQCDYCNKKRIVVELNEIMFFVTDALLHFYTDPANFMSYDSSEGGYLGEVEGPWEMLENLGLEIENRDLWDDMFNSIDHTSAWADEGTALSDFKYEGWLHFKNLVKHESRFLFIGKEEFHIGYRTYSAREFLNELSNDIRKQRMVSHIPAGTPIYRCRQHRDKDEVTTASDICTPKVEYAIYPNRMSPAGIPMFYGALNARVARLETLRPGEISKPIFSQAVFTPREDLLVIDLSKIPAISPFDQDSWDLYDRIEFLHRFLDEFSAPIDHDGREHIDYVPTQIITEFLRYNFKMRDGRKIDGILYPSSKDRRLNACVLFMSHYECLDRLSFDPADITQEEIKRRK